jgi:uncharacterized protein DUF6927
MGWTAGYLDRPFSAEAAIAFAHGKGFMDRVLATARYGTVIYAAVQASDSDDVFGLVLLAERRDGVLFTKSINEDAEPAQDECPARILDLLTPTSSECAERWRERCRARLARGRPRKGQKVVFEIPICFSDGSQHRCLIFEGGSRFRSHDGVLYMVASWTSLNYQLDN